MAYESGLIIENQKIKKIYFDAKRLAQSDVTVLIYGEAGTGKSRLAKYIKENSARKNAPFVVVNCSALPTDLFASELFGYAPNAFTGALSSGKLGLLEASDGGTVLFDEIDELSQANQATLLHFLQNKTITAIGSLKTKKIDTRIICTSGHDLKAMVDEGSFRLDLYYRINVATLSLPPIRLRTDEAEPFILHFIAKYAQEFGINADDIRFTEAEKKRLTALDWAGNIRELENFAQQLCLIQDKEAALRELERNEIKVDKNEYDKKIRTNEIHTDFKSLKDATEEFQRSYIKKAISSSENLTMAAAKLGISLSSLMRKKRADRSAAPCRKDG